MSEEQNRKIAHRCMEEFWGKGDASVAAEIFAEDCVFHIPSAPPIGRGPQAAKEFLAYVRSGFEEFQTVVDRVITNGNIAIVYGLGRGTHTGEQLGGHPTGREVTMAGVLTLRIDGGKIVDYRADWDTAAFEKQVGAPESKPSA